MTDRNIISGVMTFACLVLVTAGVLQAQQSRQQSIVRMKREVSVVGPEVRLGEIAIIHDDDSRRRTLLENLDLAEFADDAEAFSLDRSFVYVRVLLAGFEADSVLLTGPEQIVVNRSQATELTDLQVEKAAQEMLSHLLGVPQQDIQARLLSPFVGPWVANQDVSDVQLQVVPPAGLPLGRVTMTVRLLKQERLVAARPATFEVSKRQAVVVADASLNFGAVLAAGHVREEKRFVDTAVDRLVAKQVVGRKLSQRIDPGEILTMRHLAAETPADAPVLVRSRDSVRLIARKNGLTVIVPAAEALQSGKQGQVIRVRNLESNRVVTGRVVGRGEVEVPLY